MSAHTPGPWRTSSSADGIRILATESGYGLQIACVVVSDVLFEPGESQATANLMAAAPDLLAAADWIDHLRAGVGKDGGEPTPDEWTEAYDSLRAAIAKAEGR